jgi:hypothetical protein
LEKFKRLYWELQVELDKLEVIRKNMAYYQLRRENALEKIRVEFREKMRLHGGRDVTCGDGGDDVTCDCDGWDCDGCDEIDN